MSIHRIFTLKAKIYFILERRLPVFTDEIEDTHSRNRLGFEAMPHGMYTYTVLHAHMPMHHVYTPYPKTNNFGFRISKHTRTQTHTQRALCVSKRDCDTRI